MKKKAFTLAEILIVIALVGFLFTLSLPMLVQKQSAQKLIEEAKTAQENLQEAFEAASKANNGLPPQDWASVRASSDKSDAIMKEVAKKLQVMSFCGNSHKGCFSPKGYITLNGMPTTVITDEMEDNNRIYPPRQEEEVIYNQDEDGWGGEPVAKILYEEADPQFSSTYISMLNGGSVVLKTNSTKCDRLLPSTDTLERPLCGVLYVDVNGPAIPNMLGVDVFGFYLSDSNILPMGFYGDEFSFGYNCQFETPTKNKYNGLGCSAWALKNKNMEYRKCKAGTRIGWTKATRCDAPAK